MDETVCVCVRVWVLVYLRYSQFVSFFSIFETTIQMNGKFEEKAIKNPVMIRLRAALLWSINNRAHFQLLSSMPTELFSWRICIDAISWEHALIKSVERIIRKTKNACFKQKKKLLIKQKKYIFYQTVKIYCSLRYSTLNLTT